MKKIMSVEYPSINNVVNYSINQAKYNDLNFNLTLLRSINNEVKLGKSFMSQCQVYNGLMVINCLV